MAEKIVSPGVFTNEIDESFLPAALADIGAAVVGPTVKGPALVPTVVNSFAELTQDKQWIHIDQEKAAKYSPYKKTIAHGFHVLSYASQIVFQTLKLNNIALAVNYGLEKVRFPNATPAESKFRGKVSLTNIEEVSGGAKYTLKIIFEVEGEIKPVCVAETISLIYSLPN